MKTPSKPVVTLHGSGRKALLEGYTAQINAVYAAIQTLSAHAPHGRDYADEDQWLSAVQAHRARVAALFVVHAQLNAIAEGL